MRQGKRTHVKDSWHWVTVKSGECVKNFIIDKFSVLTKTIWKEANLVCRIFWALALNQTQIATSSQPCKWESSMQKIEFMIPYVVQWDFAEVKAKLYANSF